MTTLTSLRNRSFIAILSFPIVNYVSGTFFGWLFLGADTYAVKALLSFLLLGSIFVIPSVVSGLLSPNKPFWHAFAGALVYGLLLMFIFSPMVRRSIDASGVQTSLRLISDRPVNSVLIVLALLAAVSGTIGYLSAKIRDRFSR